MNNLENITDAELRTMVNDRVDQRFDQRIAELIADMKASLSEQRQV